MAASISQQLEDLLNPLPNFVDPEDDEDEGISNMAHLSFVNCFFFICLKLFYDGDIGRSVTSSTSTMCLHECTVNS